jgi:integrase/recombinase XerD
MLDGIEHDWRKEFKRLEGAYAPSTMRSYYSDIEIFLNWCNDQNLVPFPVSVETVCRFLEEQAPYRAPSTVRRRLYAIRKVNRLLRLDDPTHDEDINLTFRRIRRAKRTRPKQAKGMTRPYLNKFLAVQPDNPWGLRNRAMLLLGYELLTRRSELVALADGPMRVIIRRSKADPFGQGRVAFTSRKTAAAVLDWLAWRGTEINFMFCLIYRAGQSIGT